LYYILNRNTFYLQFDDGVKQTNLRRQDVLDCPLPVPELKEQTAIATALSDVDSLIASLDKLIAKKQAIKTATMQQLLTGKTRLPAFSHYPDGQAKGTKQSDLGEIPEDWDVKSYGEVFTFLTTATNSRADLTKEGQVGYIHYGDIHTQWDFHLDVEVASIPHINSSLVTSASYVENGDVIMADASEDYDGIGKSIEVKGIKGRPVISGLHTYLLRDKTGVFVDGYKGYLHAISKVKKTFDRLATGMKVYGISKNNLKEVLLPVPPVAEQGSIAKVLIDMDTEIQTLQQRLDKTHQLKQGMMQELLTGKTRLI